MFRLGANTHLVMESRVSVGGGVVSTDADCVDDTVDATAVDRGCFMLT